MKLTPDQADLLRILAGSDSRASRDSYVLESFGLAVNGSGRFGSWAKITEKGRIFLKTIAPAAAPGPAGPFPAGHSFRGAEPRPRRTSAKQAQPVPPGTPTAIRPPAEALVVGASSIPTPRKRRRNAT